MDARSAAIDVDIDSSEPNPGKKLKDRTGERFDLVCPECSAKMALRDSRYGGFYGCVRFPGCRATHGAHPNGAPLGIPCDLPTKKTRMRAHALFDAIWKTGKVERRGDAYLWMQRAMGLSESEAHIARFDTPQCEALILAIKKQWPDLQPTKPDPA